jgi:ribosomal protein S18 acetylase RimI-like enzyme
VKEIGRSDDRGIGRSEEPALGIRPFESDEDVEWAARVMAGSEPWITLGRGYDASRAILSDATKERYIALAGNDRAAFLILNMRGAFAGYIQTVCVADEFRGRGLGTRLMLFAEERVFRDSPNVFLCVSSFNSGARRLYERLGYRLVGELPDYLVAGHAELLMRKTIGPLAGFVGR